MNNTTLVVYCDSCDQITKEPKYLNESDDADSDSDFYIMCPECFQTIQSRMKALIEGTFSFNFTTTDHSKNYSERKDSKRKDITKGQ